MPLSHLSHLLHLGPLLQVVKVRDGGNCPEHSLVGVEGGARTSKECHQLGWMANLPCSLTDPGLKRLIIARGLITSGRECVKQHSVAALSTWSEGSHYFLVPPRPLQQCFSQDSSLGFDLFRAAQAKTSCGEVSHSVHSLPEKTLSIQDCCLFQEHFNCTIPL